MAKKSGCSNILVGLGLIFAIFIFSKGCAPKHKISSPVPNAYGSVQYPKETDLQQAPLLGRAKDGTAIQDAGKYAPKTVTLKKALDMASWEDGKYIGDRSVPAGTELPLKFVLGLDVMVEYQGHGARIPASATDILDQMVDAVGD